MFAPHAVLPKAILIDMDDTLFDERDYVKSGFQAVAAFLERSHDLPADYSYPCMMAFFDLEGRGKVFDRVIERFEMRRTDGLLDNCIDVYRRHVPSLTPYRGVRETLITLGKKARLGLATNGLPMMQRNKWQALGLDGHFEHVVFCEEIGAPKPAPDGLIAALDALNVAAADALMVGDNPETDGVAADGAGISFVRVRTQRFASVERQGPEISSINALPAFLGVV